MAVPYLFSPTTCDSVSSFLQSIAGGSPSVPSSGARPFHAQFSTPVPSVNLGTRDLGALPVSADGFAKPDMDVIQALMKLVQPIVGRNELNAVSYALTPWIADPSSANCRHLVKCLRRVRACTKGVKAKQETIDRALDAHALLKPMADHIMAEYLCRHSQGLIQTLRQAVRTGLAAQCGNANSVLGRAAAGWSGPGVDVTLNGQVGATAQFSDMHRLEVEKYVGLGLAVNAGIPKGLNLEGLGAASAKIKTQYDSLDQYAEHAALEPLLALLVTSSVPLAHQVRLNKQDLRMVYRAALAQELLTRGLKELGVLGEEQVLTGVAAPRPSAPTVMRTKEGSLGASAGFKFGAFKAKVDASISLSQVKTTRRRDLITVIQTHPDWLSDALRRSARFHRTAWKALEHFESVGLASLNLILPKNSRKKFVMLDEMLNAMRTEFRDYQNVVARNRLPAMAPVNAKVAKQRKLALEQERGIRGRVEMLQSFVVSYAALAQETRRNKLVFEQEGMPPEQIKQLETKLLEIQNELMSANLDLTPTQRIKALTVPADCISTVKKAEGKLSLGLPNGKLDLALKYTKNSDYYLPALNGEFIDIQFGLDAILGSSGLEQVQSAAADWLQRNLDIPKFDWAWPQDLALDASAGAVVTVTLFRHQDDQEFKLLLTRTATRASTSVAGALPLSGVTVGLSGEASMTRTQLDTWGSESLHPSLLEFNAVRSIAGYTKEQALAQWAALLPEHHKELAALFDHLALCSDSHETALMCQLNRLAQQDKERAGVPLKNALIDAAQSFSQGGRQPEDFERVVVALTDLYEAQFPHFVKQVDLMFHVRHGPMAQGDRNFPEWPTP